MKDSIAKMETAPKENYFNFMKTYLTNHTVLQIFFLSCRYWPLVEI